MASPAPRRSAPSRVLPIGSDAGWRTSPRASRCSCAGSGSGTYHGSSTSCWRLDSSRSRRAWTTSETSSAARPSASRPTSSSTPRRSRGRSRPCSWATRPTRTCRGSSTSPSPAAGRTAPTRRPRTSRWYRRSRRSASTRSRASTCSWAARMARAATPSPRPSTYSCGRRRRPRCAAPSRSLFETTACARRETRRGWPFSSTLGARRSSARRWRCASAGGWKRPAPTSALRPRLTTWACFARSSPGSTTSAFWCRWDG